MPSEDEVRRYYQAVWQKRKLGDLVLIKTLLYTGVRVSELVAIRLEDVGLDRCQIRINQGQGRSSMQQPSASAAFLGNLDADDRGRASLTTVSAVAGAVGLHPELSPEFLGDGQQLIEIRDPSLAVVAIAPLPLMQLHAELDPAAVGAQPSADSADDDPVDCP